jgi:hypothetical protein
LVHDLKRILGSGRPVTPMEHLTVTSEGVDS